MKRYHYGSHEELRGHPSDFLDAHNFARRLKTLSGLTPYDYICKIWTSEQDRFIVNPIHQMPGLNRELDLFVTAGQVSNYIGARALLSRLPDVDWLLGELPLERHWSEDNGDGYDADWFREALQHKGIRPCIPGRKKRKTRTIATSDGTSGATWWNAASTRSRMLAASPLVTTRRRRAYLASSTSRQSGCGSAICQHDLTAAKPATRSSDAACTTR